MQNYTLCPLHFFHELKRK